MSQQWDTRGITEVSDAFNATAKVFLVGRVLKTLCLAGGLVCAWFRGLSKGKSDAHVSGKGQDVTSPVTFYDPTPLFLAVLGKEVVLVTLVVIVGQGGVLIQRECSLVFLLLGQQILLAIGLIA